MPNTKSSATQQIHLLVEFLETPVANGSVPIGRPSAQPAVESLPVPTGISYLMTHSGNRPQLLASQRESPAEAVLIEQIFNQRHQPRLLLISPERHRARVNGQPAPRVAVLKEKDYFQLDEAIAFHVSIFNQPNIGQPGAEVIGKECLICRVPFTPESVCYTCASCGRAMHCEDEGPDRLECARLSQECPACSKPVILQAGLSFLPDH